MHYELKYTRAQNVCPVWPVYEVILYYKGRCLCLCQHSNVLPLTSPPVWKLWDTQGYMASL
jgi:hypothetical protein